MESPRMGRTAQFTETTFETEQPVGQIVPSKIIGTDANQLRASSSSFQ